MIAIVPTKQSRRSRRHVVLNVALKARRSDLAPDVHCCEAALPGRAFGAYWAPP
jgi:hypothetical protein